MEPCLEVSAARGSVAEGHALVRLPGGERHSRLQRRPSRGAEHAPREAAFFVVFLHAFLFRHPTTPSRVPGCLVLWDLTAARRRHASPSFFEHGQNLRQKRQATAARARLSLSHPLSGMLTSLAAISGAPQTYVDVTGADITAPLQPLQPDAASTLTVHLVPHTHTDCGWLKTMQKYYRDSTAYDSVSTILDAVVSSLAKNPSRRFTWVEQSFFTEWWNEQDEARRSETRKLVQSGQLQFANGGWCMHDEAASHYADMVDQTTLGHRMIIDAFGAEAVPSVAWQLDPFGHSATQAALLSAEAGMDALFFGRIDHQDQEERRMNRSAEFIWRASPSLGPDAQVFAGLTGMYRGNYVPPEEFEWITKMGPPGSNDPFEDEVNAPMLLDLFRSVAQRQADETQGRHVMWTMGSDFTCATQWPTSQSTPAAASPLPP